MLLCKYIVYKMIVISRWNLLKIWQCYNTKCVHFMNMNIVPTSLDPAVTFRYMFGNLEMHTTLGMICWQLICRGLRLYSLWENGHLHRHVDAKADGLTIHQIRMETLILLPVISNNFLQVMNFADHTEDALKSTKCFSNSSVSKRSKTDTSMSQYSNWSGLNRMEINRLVGKYYALISI